MLATVHHFNIKGYPISIQKYGNGHINETYYIKTDSNHEYILQHVNKYVFRDVPALMANITVVTQYLNKKDPDGRHTLHLIPTKTGQTYLYDEEGRYFRMYNFITEGICIEKTENPNELYACGKAFGQFQQQLSGFPVAVLQETITDFHHTLQRYWQLMHSLKTNKTGRAAFVQDEINFILSIEQELGTLLKLKDEGTLPIRVTHNDTKINNVILDAVTKEPLCVIDLDTVMPGLAAYDFGDGIRSGASAASEDERDLSLVKLSIPLFTAFAKGFIEGCDNILTPIEIQTLPWGARLMAIECGMRFLTDYLDGDIYFKTAYPEHNLIRARAQFKLYKDIVDKWDELNNIISHLNNRSESANNTSQKEQAI